MNSQDEYIRQLEAQNKAFVKELAIPFTKRTDPHTKRIIEAAKKVCNHPLQIGSVPDSFVDALWELDQALQALHLK